MLQRAYVEITNVCNLRCSFCPGTKREKKFIDPAEFRVLAEKLRLWTDYLYLHVMGEPLLHPALGEILDECDRLGFRVCVTTNGVLSFALGFTGPRPGQRPPPHGGWALCPRSRWSRPSRPAAWRGSHGAHRHSWAPG